MSNIVMKDGRPHVRMMSGQLVPCAPPIPVQAPPEKKFLIVLPYWNGDADDAESVADLVADLERMRNDSADIMFLRRFDARGISPGVIQKLQMKFGNVYQQQSRRRNATGYPFAANEMWYDLVGMMSERQWKDKYYAFIWLEADAVPTRPTWIRELIEEFRKTEAAGKHVVGHLHQHKDWLHINGVAVYSTDLWWKAGGQTLTGGSPSTAFDVDKAKVIVPMANDTPLVYLDFQRGTISRDELYAAHKGGVSPAVYHGVKDSSARLAVRQQWLNAGAEGQIKTVREGTVFTYYQPVGQIAVGEEQKALQLWRDAWASKGWYPVVLSITDARKSQHYAAYEKRVSSFPTINPPEYERACWMRWLALEAVGGGLITDYDVLPNHFTPGVLKHIALEPKKWHGMSADCPCAVYADRDALESWIMLVMGYRMRAVDQENGRPHFSDQSLLEYVIELQRGDHVGDDTFADHMTQFLSAPREKRICFDLGETGYLSGRLVHFNHGSLHKWQPNRPRSDVELQYLQGSLPILGDQPAPAPEPAAAPEPMVQSTPQIEPAPADVAQPASQDSPKPTREAVVQYLKQNGAKRMGELAEIFGCAKEEMMLLAGVGSGITVSRGWCKVSGQEVPEEQAAGA